MIVFISGLPGSGKSTLGSLVSKELGWLFVEADTFLTEEMKLQIKEGYLLSPEQLDNWVVDGVIKNLVELEKEQPVIAAGMLAETKYVQMLNNRCTDILYINLEVPYTTLLTRVSTRDHFAGKVILDACWEHKADFILPGPTVNGGKSLQTVVNNVISIIKSHNPS